MPTKGPKVTNQPISAVDEIDHPVATAVNPPAREISLIDEPRPDVATGDEDSIADWAKRRAERVAIEARKASE